MGEEVRDAAPALRVVALVRVDPRRMGELLVEAGEGVVEREPLGCRDRRPRGLVGERPAALAGAGEGVVGDLVDEADGEAAGGVERLGVEEEPVRAWPSGRGGAGTPR